MKIERKFKNSIYFYIRDYAMWIDANHAANSIRQQGYFARVIPCKGGFNLYSSVPKTNLLPTGLY